MVLARPIGSVSYRRCMYGLGTGIENVRDLSGAEEMERVIIIKIN